jgi:hypothetical protein
MARFCGTFSWHLFVEGSVAHHILSSIAWCQNVQNHIIKPTYIGGLWQMSLPFVSIIIAWHSTCPKTCHQSPVWWDAIDVLIPPLSHLTSFWLKKVKQIVRGVAKSTSAHAYVQITQIWMETYGFSLIFCLNLNVLHKVNLSSLGSYRSLL